VVTEDGEVRFFIEQTGARVAGKQGWTDVAQFSEAGVPAFNFGPGVPETAHMIDEYCPVENLGKAYAWLARFLREGPRSAGGDS
jgi:succinyl-diaminopimelate desuccinylase